MEQELLWATSTYVILAHVPRDGVFSTALVRGSTKPIRNSLFALCPSWTATKSGLTLKNCSNQTADRVGYSINSSAGDRYNFAIGGELVEVQSFVSSQLKIELSSNESVSEQPVDRITIPLLQRWKQDGRRLVMTTAYDAVAAPIPDPSIDISLVGDSGGNVCLGFENTPPVSVAMMNHHLEAAVRSKPRALLVADMSFLSFHVSVEETIRNAGGFLQRGAAAARLEGGGKRIEMVRAIVDCEIPVMGHLGLVPQSVNVMGGFKVQGRKVDEALRLLDDAHRLQEASCFALVLEGTPAELTARVSDSLTIPTIGIGSGPDCSEQVLCFMTCWAKPKVIAPNSFPPIRKAFSSSMMRFRAGQRMSAVARSPARKSPIGFPKALGRQLPTGRHPPQIITSVAELRRTLAKSRSANQRAGLCRRWAISTMATWR